MYSARKLVSNDTDKAIEVVLEPWGMPLQLLAGQVFELVAESAHPGKLEIDRDAVITAYAWSGATLNVYAAGVLVHSQTIAVPEAPAGTSIRQFMASVGLTKS
jgi:hypothetical protein